MAALHCGGCGKPFEPKREHGRFCSDRCRLDAWALKRITARAHNGSVQALTLVLGPQQPPADPRDLDPEWGTGACTPGPCR